MKAIAWCAAFLSILAGCVAAAQTRPSLTSKCSPSDAQTAYRDAASGIELRISEGGYRVTAIGPACRTLWSRADYKEAGMSLFGQTLPLPQRAWIGRFRPLPEGREGAMTLEYARRLGLKGKVLIVDYAAPCCHSAQGYISLRDGKLVNAGFN